MGESASGPDEPTRLGTAEAETQAVQAWAMADEYDGYVERPFIRRLSSRTITAAAVGVSLIAVVTAAVVAGYLLHGDPPAPVADQPPPTLSRVVPPAPAQPVSASPVPAGFPPSSVTVTVHAPAAPLSPRSSGPVLYTTYISWVGAPCIQIRYPDGDLTRVGTTCAPTHTDTVQHTAISGEIIGADPVMGQATALACRVMVDATNVTVMTDSGTAGDGHDINCMISAP